MTRNWYARIKDGEVKVCPVAGCGGHLTHWEPPLPAMYECSRCGWTDEMQDFADLGWANQGPGWPTVVRRCALCGATSDGTAPPSVEFVHCACREGSHAVCRVGGCSAGSKDNVRLCPVEFKACPLPKPQEARP